MAAPVLLIPIDAGMTAALAARTALTGDVSWKLEIDEGAGYLDRTTYLDANQLSISASGSVFKPAEAAQASWKFRNRPKVWSEGDLANAPVKISVKIGASAYIQLFTGYVSEAGCYRDKRNAMVDTISVTAYDPARYRGLRRKVPSASLLNYKICNTGATATSIAHYLAAAMGLAAGDCDFYDLNYTKDYFGLDGQSRAWNELQDLATHYGALLHFRYDGKLRLAVWTAAEWNAAAVEYTFDSTNIHPFTAVGSGIFCNRARTEWSQYQALPVGSILYKNYDSWDDALKRNAIVVAAGEYWPGGTDSLAVGRLQYGFNGEAFPIGTSITTPTLGATGAGKDIEYDGAGLSIISFNGSTGDTRQNLNSSEIILRNTSGSPLTIRKFQLRGTPLRELKQLRVEHVDAGVANEWEEVEREIPGKAATTEALAKQIVRRYVDFGATPRKRYEATVDFTPHLQIGTLVTFNPTADVNLTCFVEGYRHVSAGPHSQTRTRVSLVERVDFNAAGAGSTETHSPGIGTGIPYQGAIVVGASTYDGYCDLKGDGTADESELNSAIVTANARGGGRVIAIGGTFVTAAAVELLDNVTLEIDPSATIEKNCNDYAIKCVGTSGTHKTNVKIAGTGMITRNAADNNAKPLVYFEYTDDSAIEGVTVDDSYNDGIDMVNCSNVKLEGALIIKGCAGTGLRLIQSIVIIAAAVTITACAIGYECWPKEDTNLIDRGDCESATAPMVSGETVPSLIDCTWARSNAQKYAGTYSYKLTASAANAYARLVDGVAANDMHGLTAGKCYLLIGKVYTVFATTAPRFLISYSTDGSTWQSASAIPRGPVLNTWANIQLIVKLPTATTGVVISCVAGGEPAGHASYWDNFELYEFSDADSGLQLVNSSIADCTDIGVRVINSHAIIQNNQVTGCTNQGVEVLAGYRNIVSGNRAYNNGADAGIENANGDNFYDAGIDTQQTGNSWNFLPVAGQPGWGEPHTEIETLVNAYDPAVTSDFTVTVSNAPNGVRGIEGYCDVLSATTAGRSLYIKDMAGNTWVRISSISTAIPGRGRFKVPLDGNKQFVWSVSGADVNVVNIVRTDYYF